MVKKRKKRSSPRLFEVTTITKTGRTGKSLGIIRAKGKIAALKKLKKAKKLPRFVRVFPLKFVSAKKLGKN